MLMHSWGSDGKGKSKLFCTDCAAPGLHWSLASGLTRKAMCTLQTDIELKLVLNAPEREFVFWGREQEASIPASFWPLFCQGGTTFEVI